jgi:hypothetical protein
MSEKPRRYRQPELHIENVTQRTRLIKDDLVGLHPDFVRWVLEANKRRRRADAAVQVLLNSGLASNYREGLEHLQSVVLENLNNGTTELRRSDFKNRFHLYGTRGLVARSKDQISIQEQAGLSTFAYGSINHRVAFDAMEGKLPRRRVSKPASGYEMQQGKLFDLSPFAKGATHVPQLTDDGRMPDQYAIDVFDSLFTLQEMNAEGDVTSDQYFEQLKTFEDRVAPILGTHYDELQEVRRRLEYDQLYAPALMSVASSVLYSHGVGDRVLFRELPVMSWQRNHMGGGRVDALEITGFEGRAPTPEEDTVLQGLSERKYSSIGDLLLTVGDTITPWMTARIIDVKCGIGDATRFNRMITGDEIAEGPIPRHLEQVRDYLTHAPVDLFTHEYDDGRELDPDRIWNDDDGISEGEVLYFHPTVPPKSFRFTMTPDEKRDHFKTTAVKLEQAQANAQIRGIDTTVGRYAQSITHGGKKQGGYQYSINPQILDLMQRFNE